VGESFSIGARRSPANDAEDLDPNSSVRSVTMSCPNVQVSHELFKSAYSRLSRPYEVQNALSTEKETELGIADRLKLYLQFGHTILSDSENSPPRLP
jgi:hypothetical protein